MTKKHRSPNDRNYGDTFTCSRCGKTKPIARFDRSKKRDNYIIPVCKDCRNKRNREIRKRKRDVRIAEIKPSPGMRRCSTCQQVKPESDFYESSVHFDGLSRQCRECKQIHRAKTGRALKIRAMQYLGSECHDCHRRHGDGKYHFAFFDFHHDPELGEKEHNIATLMRKKREWGKEIEDELDKCVLLCSECHRKRHSYLLDDGSINPSRVRKKR